MNKTVIFEGVTDDAQVTWGGHTDPRGLLEVGEEYEVVKYEEHAWYTRVFLKGFDGHFNSIWFEGGF